MGQQVFIDIYGGLNSLFNHGCIIGSVLLLHFKLVVFETTLVLSKAMLMYLLVDWQNFGHPPV